MRTASQVLFIALSILFLSNFPFSFAGRSSDTDYPKVPVPPTPQCFGFPGSAEWEKCWRDFRDQMQTYHQQMIEYQKKLQAMNNQSSSDDGATTSVFSNGYTIRAKNLNVNTNSVNGQTTVETFIGSPESLNVTTEGRTIKWECIRNDQVDRWLTLTPPDSVNLSSIEYETKNQHLYILAPADPNYTGTGSSSSSSSNFVSSGGGTSYSNSFVSNS